MAFMSCFICRNIKKTGHLENFCFSGEINSTASGAALSLIRLYLGGLYNDAFNIEVT
jgi:hypothetical protein